LPADLLLKPAVFKNWVDGVDKHLITDHDAECAKLMEEFKIDLLTVRFNTMKADFDKTVTRLQPD
jgi:hypothetical protein